MDTLLDRFCRYVKVETTADETSETYPSTATQFDLAKILAEELRAMGAQDVSVSEFGIVMGTIPGNVDGAPTIAWFAHMDTSPEAPGKNVKPVVHENYDGNDIVLPGDESKVIRTNDATHLQKCKGKTIITTDGTTLLGADDKAGVASIMTAAAALLADTSTPHGPIRVVFTCDEEIGKGTDHVDLSAVGAVCGYTLDGEGAGGIENETFSADVAAIKITGRNTHPGYATGRMINAIRVASEFISRLPRKTLTPETTGGKDGFLHPYTMTSSVEEANLRIILRSFNTSELAEQAELLRAAARTVEAEFPGSKIDINITEQYRNMLEFLKKEPRAVSIAETAMRNLGLEPVFESIRGGTDGSRFSEKGLPTPNLATGMHNFHSVLEFAVLEEMQTAADVLVEIAKLWGKERA